MGSVTEPAPGEYGPPEPGVDQGGERDTSGDHGFFGQPRPLVHIFGVEMWERFSFYGMQGILLLYLYYSAVDGGLGMDQTDCRRHRRRVRRRGLPLDDPRRVDRRPAARLGARAVLQRHRDHGRAHRARRDTGIRRASASACCSSRSARAGSRRMPRPWSARSTPSTTPGATPGSRSSTSASTSERSSVRSSPGLVQQHWGFHWGFALAAVGMAIGLTQYAFGRKSLPPEASVVPNPLPRNRRARDRHRRDRVRARRHRSCSPPDHPDEPRHVGDRRHRRGRDLVLRRDPLQPAASRRPSAAASTRSSRCSSRASRSGRCTSSSSRCSRSTPTSS